jgi:mannose-1-phosphate guanylyltransferase
VERETFPALVADDAVVMGYLDTSYWLDVGTPEAFVQGSCDLVLGRLASPALTSARGGARVDGSVLFDGVRVGAGARVSASVLGRGARIGESVVLDGAVIGDDVTVASGNELRAGIRVWPGVDLGPTSVRFSTDA